MFEQFLLNGIIQGSLYALVALGFSLVYTTTHTFHIAYAAIYIIAPYLMLSFLFGLGVPFIIAVLLAVICVGIFSWFIEFSVYQPLVKKSASGNVILVSSIGVMIVVVNIITMVYGNETKILNPNISKSFTIGGVIITVSQIYQFVISSFILIAFYVFLVKTRFGLIIRALRDDPTFIKIFGIKVKTFDVKVKQLRAVLFILSGMLAAVGSILIAHDVGMDPYVGMPILLNAMVALIIGGITKFGAPIIGGFTLGIIQALTVMFLSAKWQDASTFVILIIVLLFFPNGILPNQGFLKMFKRSSKQSAPYQGGA